MFDANSTGGQFRSGAPVTLLWVERKMHADIIDASGKANAM